MASLAEGPALALPCACPALRQVWPDGFVGVALAVCVTEPRLGFGDEARDPRYVATVFGGYR